MVMTGTMAQAPTLELSVSGKTQQSGILLELQVQKTTTSTCPTSMTGLLPSPLTYLSQRPASLTYKHTQPHTMVCPVLILRHQQLEQMFSR